MGRTSNKRPIPTVVHPDEEPTAASPRTLAHEIGILEISRRLGGRYSLTSVSKIFNGHRRPKMTSARMLADAMGITLDQLYDEIEKAHAQMSGRVA